MKKLIEILKKRIPEESYLIPRFPEILIKKAAENNLPLHEYINLLCEERHTTAEKLLEIYIENEEETK